MPYNFVADSIHTEKLCSRLSSKEVHFQTENSRFAILSPPLGAQGNALCSSQAHWKVRSELPIIELFFARTTAEVLRAKIDRKSTISLQRGQLDPKFQVQGVVPHQPFFVSDNQNKRSFISYKNVGTSFFRYVTMHTFVCLTDRWTDGQKGLRNTVCVALHAVAYVKMTKFPTFSRYNFLHFSIIHY